ncbi:MAG: RecQ family ATP-dependent DNA helicase [Oceanospirillaceae bacterium]
MYEPQLAVILKQRFGFTEFRAGQQEVISQLLFKQQSSLAIFPTGSGKSLCYQLAATQLPHLTLVISPLLALMKDQLAFLQANNIAAASIDSSLSVQQSQQVMQDLHSGLIKVLMVSVERFKNERFRQAISSTPISMLVVDEAHCISEWGHNFRPDYLKIPSYQQWLKIPLVLLLTATATAEVKRDMASKFNIVDENIVQTGFYRQNLELNVESVSASVKDQRLVQLIKEYQYSGKPVGIVYVTLQKTAENIANKLITSGINAAAYHAGLLDEQRQTIQSKYMANGIDVVVATIAFGMGIDKSNVQFVVHYDLPKSIENYSQEIGRAGRDGQHAYCCTLANLDNLNTLENFVYGDTPELTAIEYVINNIRDEQQYQQWETQIYSLSNNSNIRQLTLKTLLVQLELMGILQAKYSYYAQFKLQLLVPQEQILSTFNSERQQFLQQIFQHTDFKKVWGILNFDSLFQASQCDRARVVTALNYLESKQMITLQTSQITEVFSVNTERLIEPNLATQLYQYFLDKEHKEIKRIQALVDFFELDSCLTYNLAQYFDDKSIMEQGFTHNDGLNQCGHCSVCKGKVAKLAYSKDHHWPEAKQLEQSLVGLKNALYQVGVTDDSHALGCRFLAGISLPIFTKIKARKLAGFGCCEHQRYQQIMNKIEQIM